MAGLVSYQHFVIDALGERKPLEDFTEELEHLGRVLRFHLTLEPVHLIHVIRLVVAFTKDILDQKMSPSHTNMLGNMYKETLVCSSPLSRWKCSG